MRRAAVIVMDACGVGALPDAAAYGDEGTDTLGHLAQRAGGLELPVLGSLGLGSILPLEGVPPAVSPALHGRVGATGPGKESTTGHWELMGVKVEQALPTYPEGFPGDVVAALERATGQRFCCNRPFSGTAVLDAFGEHHLKTGELILYTSADSVLQIAAHVDVLSEPELYRVCAAAREVMDGEHAVGRVIARPFEGGVGAWHRREGRRDFSVPPPTRSYLEELQAAGEPVHGVGKIRDLFAGVGVDVKHPGATNAEGIAATTELLRSLSGGLIFVNLVETDQLYGHRHDVPGFAAALRAIDDAVAGWLELLRDGDLLILTADHGVDPTTDHTDHTREYAPLLARFDGDGGRRHDGALADVGASVMRWLTGRDVPELPGTSFL
ncbi:MAG TPA: phosphopentomutase [Solirubrobacteraceae bacterium]|jgi:phosphopentomutase|nr:phosphopentomutase [Solirubrobacteraceae bacterium]